MKIFSYLLMGMVAAAMAACSVIDEPTVESQREPGDQVRLTLIMPAGSRAESHPDEAAINRENEVENLTIFFYTASEGLNGSPSTALEHARYFTKEQFKQTGNSIDIEFGTGTYLLTASTRLAVVANMGNQTRLRTLGDLQQLRPGSTYTPAASFKDYHLFTMANADNSDDMYTLPGLDENGNHRFKGSVTIERTAARIDFDPEGSTWEEEEERADYHYEAKDKNGQKYGDVYLSHIIPFNRMTRPSYALKRISDLASKGATSLDSWTYTGTLDKDATGRPVRYVVEPQTCLKGSAAEKAEEWYGDSRAALIAAEGHGYFNRPGVKSLKALRADEGRLQEGYLVVDYADENTQHVDNSNSTCMTGLLLRAHYCPTKLHYNAELTDPKAAAYGQTLWRYTPQNATTSEADVLYFASEEAAKAYNDTHPGDQAEIRSFPQGICYYFTWIRHTVLTNDQKPRPTFPMEYGIVRNHIYRIQFNFHGIGRDGTRITERDNLEAKIYVRPWAVFRHPDIVI